MVCKIAQRGRGVCVAVNYHKKMSKGHWQTGASNATSARGGYVPWYDTPLNLAHDTPKTLDEHGANRVDIEDGDFGCRFSI